MAVNLTEEQKNAILWLRNLRAGNAPARVQRHYAILNDLLARAYPDAPAMEAFEQRTKAALGMRNNPKWWIEAVRAAAVLDALIARSPDSVSVTSIGKLLNANFISEELGELIVTETGKSWLRELRHYADKNFFRQVDQ